MLLFSPIRRQAPSTRASISHATVLTPTGPNHCPNCPASVQAANTRSGSVSKVRVMRRMRSLVDLFATAPSLCRLGGRALDRRGALQERVEPVELLLPEAAI